MNVDSTDKGPVFTPISFTLTVETEDELLALWHRFNASEATLKGTASAKVRVPERLSMGGVFRAVNHSVKRRGLFE